MNLSISASKLKRAFPTILLFLLVLLASDRLLFFLISTAESTLFSDRQFREGFKAHMKEKKISTLILGTSRTYEGIHPCYFQNILGETAYKEARPGKGPKYNYHFYQFYRKEIGIPEIMIYGIDYFIFNIESSNRWLSRFNYRTDIDYMLPGLLLLKHKKKINEFIDTVIDWLKSIPEGNNIRTPQKDMIATQKYRGVNPKKQSVISKKPKYFKRFRYHKSPGIEGDYFKSLLELSQKDGVTVLLVMLPDYYGTNLSNIQKRIFIRDIQNLADKFSNVRLYNYNSIRKFPLNRTELFLNGGYGLTNSHLSRKGAFVFNRILLDDIRHHYSRMKLKEKKAGRGDGQNTQKKIY